MVVLMGVLGFLDGVMEGDEEDEETGGGGEEGDLFGEGGGGLDEGGDMGGLDEGGMDDFDDDGEFGDLGEGDSSVVEVEERVDEIENEVSQMSSTVSTVKRENEEISEQLGDIEENVRTLLEIYEMVTRGVNPFADDSSVSAGDGFDLFDTDEAADEAAPGGDEVMETEAESFFEDDEFDEGNELEETEEEGDDMDMTETDDSGGASFDELKEEYEEGGGDEWEEEESDEALETEDEEGDGEVSFDELKEEYEGEDEEETEDEAEAVPPPEEETESVETSEATDTKAVEEAEEEPKDEIEKIYADERIKLEDLPRGYASDALIMEWVNYLIDESGVEDAIRSVNYYSKIEWVSDDAADEMKRFMLGHPEVEEEDVRIDSAAPSSVGMDSHLESLRYVSRLEGGTDGREVVEHMG